MNSSLARRDVARGALWVAPAITIAAAAPASAVSCTPTTENRTAAITWVSAQTAFDSPTGDPEYHTVQYTFTNNGPDSLPPGFLAEVDITMTVAEGEEVNVELLPPSDNVTSTISNSFTTDPNDQSVTDRAHVKITTTQEIAPGDVFTVTVYATYGYLPSGTVEDVVTVESPQTIYTEATCTTISTTATTTGGSNGTSYTSPP